MADLVAYPMNGGDGLYSYSRNSNFQVQHVTLNYHNVVSKISFFGVPFFFFPEFLLCLNSYEVTQACPFL